MSTVQVIYVPKGDIPVQREVTWVPQMTVADALELSELPRLYPEVMTLTVGIFSRMVSWDTLVKPEDRIECYRPLLIDPKEKRRRRAKA